MRLDLKKCCSKTTFRGSQLLYASRGRAPPAGGGGLLLLKLLCCQLGAFIAFLSKSGLSIVVFTTAAAVEAVVVCLSLPVAAASAAAPQYIGSVWKKIAPRQYRQ